MSRPETVAQTPVVTTWKAPTWAIGAPAALLLGFLALLGRAGVGIQALGLPLGAYLTPLPTLAVLGLLMTRAGRALLTSLNRPQQRIAIAVGIAVGVGVLRAAAQGMPTLLRFQDMAYLLHLPWIVVGMTAMQLLPTDEERSRVLRWLAWTLAIVLVLHWARGPIPTIDWLFDQLVRGLEGVSDKPTNLVQDGDRALHSITLAALALHLVHGGKRSRAALVGIAGLLVGTHLSLFTFGGSRGALLGALIGGIVLLATPSPRQARWLLTGTAILAFALSAGIKLASVPDLSADPIPALTPDRPDTAGPITMPEPLGLRERYEILADRRALTITGEQLRVEDGQFALDSTVSWRIEIWTDVIEEWNSSWTNRAFGIGFGNEIVAMTVAGRQGFDGMNRGVHSIFFTVLARQGILGIISTACLIAALFFSYRLTKPWTVPITYPIVITGLVYAFFDVALEGVHVPIALWSTVGIVQHARVSPDSFA